MADSKAGKLLIISPDQIRANPDNPRMIFREDEINALLESIQKVGIQVPLTVYEDKGYVILDGERRWRCSKRLNLRAIPCIVHPKPTRIENLLMMFNIHNVRVQWDWMPTAYKLKEVKDLLGAEGRDVSDRAIAAITGVPMSSVKRCFELLDLPEKYQAMLIREAEKPKSQQKVTADLFLEINKSYKTLEKYTPEVVEETPHDDFLDAMFQKYSTGVVKSVTEFRQLSKIARAERAGGDREEAVKSIERIVSRPSVSISSAFERSVAIDYDRRNLLTRVNSLALELQREDIDEVVKGDVRNALRELLKVIRNILK